MIKKVLIIVLCLLVALGIQSQDFSYTGTLKADGVNIDVGNRAFPTFADIDGDSDLDLYIGENDGYIYVFKNYGTGYFSSEGYLQTIYVGSKSSPTFADIDCDNDLDLYIGASEGYIYIYTNDGSGNFISAGYLQDSDGYYIYGGPQSTPIFADLDNDLDLYLGRWSGNYGGIIKVFINDGNGNFSSVGFLQADGSDIAGYGGVPEFEDIDGDNDLDLFVGTYDGYFSVYMNDGNGNFSYTGYLQADGSDIYVEYINKLAFADLDNDNDPDLYIGEWFGTILVYENIGDSFISSFHKSDISVYPNPTLGIVSFEPSNEKIKKITISDITGKQVFENINLSNIQSIDLSDFKNGIYTVSIQTENKIYTTKIIKR